MHPVALMLSAAVLASSPVALAQPRAADARDDYVFDDDDLLGGTLGTPPPLLRGGKRGLRILLIRPRASFVAELVKSVEAL